MNNPTQNNAKNSRWNRWLYLALSHYFNIFVIFSIALILLIGFFGVLKPKYQNIVEELKEKNEFHLMEKDSLIDNKLRMEKYKRSYDQVSAAMKQKIDSFLPLELDKDVMFMQMEKMVTSRGYTLKSIALAETETIELGRGRPTTGSKSPLIEPPPGVGTLIIDLEISSIDYKGLKLLLGVFEKSLRLYDVVEIGFSQENNEASLKIQTYYSL
jgi:hypothetical protein